MFSRYNYTYSLLNSRTELLFSSPGIRLGVVCGGVLTNNPLPVYIWYSLSWLLSLISGKPTISSEFLLSFPRAAAADADTQQEVIGMRLCRPLRYLMAHTGFKKVLLAVFKPETDGQANNSATFPSF